MNVLIFDIETVPDVEGGRRLHDLEGLSDADVANVMFHKRRQETGGEFLRLHLHRIVAISAVLRSSDTLKVWSLGEEDSPEQELIQRFFDGLDRFAQAYPHMAVLNQWPYRRRSVAKPVPPYPSAGGKWGRWMSAEVPGTSSP